MQVWSRVSRERTNLEKSEGKLTFSTNNSIVKSNSFSSFTINCPATKLYFARSRNLKEKKKKKKMLQQAHTQLESTLVRYSEIPFPSNARIPASLHVYRAQLALARPSRRTLPGLPPFSPRTSPSSGRARLPSWRTIAKPDRESE